MLIVIVKPMIPAVNMCITIYSLVHSEIYVIYGLEILPFKAIVLYTAYVKFNLFSVLSVVT